uniref:CCHC-type domain-containing protein n=1 Tax=Anolis carolinensis TaxID=28377 RepID=A0A803SQY5_ANOCA
MSRRECYSCGRGGHIARNCPGAKKRPFRGRYSCGKGGGSEGGSSFALLLVERLTRFAYIYFLKEKGKENGGVAMKNCMMKDSGCSSRIWPEALHTSNFIVNHLWNECIKDFPFK